MIKGGYKIINLGDTVLDVSVTAGVVIPGIYEQIQNNYRKPLLLSGINISGAQYNDAFVMATATTNLVTINVYGYTITINSTDTVIIKVEE